MNAMHIIQLFSHVFNKNKDKISDQVLDAVHKIKDVLSNNAELQKQLENEILTKSLDVIKAEATSEDPFVRRARPAFLYIGYIILLANFFLFPILNIAVTKYIDQQTLYWFFWLFGSGYLGYGTFRTIDKIKK